MSLSLGGKQQAADYWAIYLGTHQDVHTRAHWEESRCAAGINCWGLVAQRFCVSPSRIF